MYFLLLLCIPAIEIWLFIVAGGAFGVLTTLLLCLLTAAVGIGLVRLQGLMALRDMVTRTRQDQVQVAGSLLQGGLLLIAGVSLLIPGFFSDTIGFLLLSPAIRRAVAQSIQKRFAITPTQPSGATIIDADYTVHTPEQKTEQTRENSPWLSRENEP